MSRHLAWAKGKKADHNFTTITCLEDERIKQGSDYYMEFKVAQRGKNLHIFLDTAVLFPRSYSIDILASRCKDTIHVIY